MTQQTNPATHSHPDFGPMEPVELHRRVEECVNAGDVNGLVELYEPTAQLLGPDGEVAAGTDAIRAAWTVVLGGHMNLVTRFVVVAEDVRTVEQRLDNGRRRLVGNGYDRRSCASSGRR